MVKHAELMLPREGLTVLNIGFGLGLIDTEYVVAGSMVMRVTQLHKTQIPEAQAFKARYCRGVAIAFLQNLLKRFE